MSENNVDEQDMMWMSNVEPNYHVPSHLQADTLFHFMTKLEFILKVLKSRKLFPRYHEEQISYLQIQDLRKLTIPMKCFCDINLHRLSDHTKWYGAYGIAFSKEWGMNKGIQPVQYINSESPLCKDMAEAFQLALSSNSDKEDIVTDSVKNFMLLQLMYWKPYQGEETIRNSIQKEEKCYCDESEWRYIPDLTDTGMQMVLLDEEILGPSTIDNYNETLEEVDQAALTFEFEEIKYIILERKDDYQEFIRAINSWNLKNDERDLIVSKIIFWEDSKEDF